MANKDQINSLVQSFALECQEDFDGLWRIVKHVKEDGLASEPNEVQKLTYDIIRTLLGMGIVAGNFHEKNSHIYNFSPDEIIALIDHEWAKLGRDPTIGEIISFTSKELAQKLSH